MRVNWYPAIPFTPSTICSWYFIQVVTCLVHNGERVRTHHKHTRTHTRMHIHTQCIRLNWHHPLSICHFLSFPTNRRPGFLHLSLRSASLWQCLVRMRKRLPVGTQQLGRRVAVWGPRGLRSTWQSCFPVWTLSFPPAVSVSVPCSR